MIAFSWMAVCILIIVTLKSQYIKQHETISNLACCNIEDKPLIAQHSVMFADDWIHDHENQHIKYKYRSIQEYRIIKDDSIANGSYCKKLLLLFKLNLFNEHM